MARLRSTFALLRPDYARRLCLSTVFLRLDCAPMPELPEVETVRRSLLPRLQGRHLLALEVHAPRLREPLDATALGRIVGQRIVDVRRRAKYLLVDGEAGQSLVVHLGMTGNLTVVDDGVGRETHEHVVFRLSDGGRLRFVDARRFGLVFVIDRSAIDGDRHFAHLGVEPLTDAFNGDYLRSQASRRRGPVKSFLMDGRVVVGVGNIYASEALWRAGVHPRRAVDRISKGTWERLVKHVRQTLDDAIVQGGTTLSDFHDGDGNAGYFQISLQVYGRAGEPCHRCQRPLRRIVQAGRSTFYCPGCQR